jgi:hypothetical protein
MKRRNKEPRMSTPQIHIRNLNINVRAPEQSPVVSLLLGGLAAAAAGHAAARSVDKPKSTERFELSADGTYVTDHRLGLLWAADESEKEFTWADAKTYAEASRIDGQPGRLPTQDELQSLRDLTKYNPCIGVPFKSRAGWVWTDTETPWSSGLVFCVNFHCGGVSDLRRLGKAFVRPVRSVSPSQ